jgi:hypothetical protein
MARGVVGQHRGENPPKFRQRIGFQIVHQYFVTLCPLSAAESQSLSIETGLQLKRIREAREQEKEFLDINWTKDSSLLLHAIHSLSILVDL